MDKPAIDPVTGCGYIKNCTGYMGRYRGCSVCHVGICVHDGTQYILEVNVDYCWSCGTEFDHMDDEPKEGEYA